MSLVQLVLVVSVAFAATARVQANTDWHRVFERDNDKNVMQPEETLELLKQVARGDASIAPDEKDAPSKEQLEELADFCVVSDDKCRAGYLRDLKIKANYHAFTKQWTLNRYLDRCRLNQELFCSRNIDASVEQALNTLPSNKLDLIKLMFDKLRGQMFSKGSLNFAEASNQDYRQIFGLCYALIEPLEDQLARYRWLKDENLGDLVKKQQTEDWLTNGERCKYFLANRGALVDQVTKYKMTLRTQGRFADSKPAQKV